MSAAPGNTPALLRVAVRGIGVLGPGLADWARGRALLRTPQDWLPQAALVPAPQRLPATERRRAGMVVKASVVVADEACAAAGIDPSTLATVFSSSTGDPTNCHLLCEALATADRMVSPTRFTNSVHNAAAGYWHIATQSRQPSTSLAAFDASFAAGLLEAAVQCVASGLPVLLVACDVPYPEPLHAKRPLADLFAVALVLAPTAGAQDEQLPWLTLRTAREAPSTACDHAGLQAVQAGNPAARALPLLLALAAFDAGVDRRGVVLEGLPGSSLQVDVGGRA